MADISDVNIAVIKDLYQRLESLSCRSLHYCHRYNIRSADDIQLEL